MKIIPFLFAITLFLQAYGQNKLEEIERSFAEKNITISNRIGDSVVKNQFEMYLRITSRSFIRYKDKIYESNTVFKNDVDYYDYRFLDSIYFNHVEFWSKIDFSLSNFHKVAGFYESDFKDKVSYTWVLFYDDVNFSRSSFAQSVSFISTHFMGKTDFFHTNFYGHADFHGAEFNGKSSFIDARFRNSVDFSFAGINKKVNFRNAKFSEFFSMNNASINGEADFYKATFDSIADFSNCDVSGILNFNSIVLPDFLDLSGITDIENIIDLTEAKSNEKYRICKINLINSDISKIRLRYDNFVLWFPPNTSYEVKCNIYDALLTMLKDNGYQTSYQKLDIEYQKFKYMAKGHEFRSYVQEIWWNYGYNKELIFLWIFRIVSILTLINTLFLAGLMERVYEMKFLNYEKIKERAKIHHPVLNFFLNIPTGFLYTVILLIGGVFGMGFNSGSINTPSFIGLIYIISVGLLGLSCSAFILNFIFAL